MLPVEVLPVHHVLRKEVIDIAGEWAVRGCVSLIVLSLVLVCSGIAALGAVLCGAVEVEP